jgi:hypothetical protein
MPTNYILNILSKPEVATYFNGLKVGSYVYAALK